MTKVSFIGLGNMGLPMAKNLVRAGHDVTGFDLVEGQLTELVKSGGKVSENLNDTLKNSEVVITMLPSGKHVKSVYLGEEGIIKNSPAGLLLIDSSTIDVESAREVEEVANKSNLKMLDAPVSGGVTGAEAGTLTFMVGGDEEAFEKGKELLDIMGGNVIHAGQAGNGQVAKICNNMLLAISMIGTSEAFNLAERLGLDSQTFYDISSTASGQCWSMTSYCPVPGPVPTSPANNNYKPGFSSALMLKDLRLSQEASKITNTETPLGAHSTEVYEKMEKGGYDNLDFSGVIKLISGELK
ncbi:MAG: 3-hydroxyisobutyrate dehydrogenase [Rhodobiaceae bacterium]|jgi:3-hydroxyisobutyrate dehydrogenase|nr:3-hydroxyisobutyrate dehydrogenase [Rhodobiaceae bacterium]